MIVTCTCIHEVQDRLYGRHRRVANECPNVNNNTTYRCTVCRKEHTGTPVKDRNGGQ